MLDDEKKLLVVQFIGSGLSRREAAKFVECADTTIGRTAARDRGVRRRAAPGGIDLSPANRHRHPPSRPGPQVLACGRLDAGTPLARRLRPRDPNSFTSDQVMSLLARLYGETLPLLPAEKVEQFQGCSTRLDEVQAKCGREERADDDAEEDDGQRDHLASRNGAAGGNGHVPGKDGAAGLQEAAPSGNGHHGPEPAAAPSNGHSAGLSADVRGGRRTVPSTQYTVEAMSNNGKLRSEQVEREEPLAEREEHAGPPTGRFARRQPRLDKVVRRFDSAKLHQPHLQGVGAGCESDDRKVMPVNALQQESTECTTR